MTTTKDDITKAAEKNHIWISAFSLINPSDEMAMMIGREVIRMLADKSNLLPGYYGENPQMDGLAKLTPTLYMSVNAS